MRKKVTKDLTDAVSKYSSISVLEVQKNAIELALGWQQSIEKGLEIPLCASRVFAVDCLDAISFGNGFKSGNSARVLATAIEMSHAPRRRCCCSVAAMFAS